jgi:hypothetical protein
MFNNWLFFKHWYENVASKVRWKQNLSDSINELQGVRQGGVWSPTAYKIEHPQMPHIKGTCCFLPTQ